MDEDEAVPDPDGLVIRERKGPSPLQRSLTDPVQRPRELARVVAPGGEVHLLGGTETLSESVASGWSFPDALAASAPAARDGVPILLTAPNGIPAEVETLLAERDFDQVHVIGGPAVADS